MLFRMTVMWSVSSFSLYLMLAMNKYLEGDIYINNYIDGVAGILAALFGNFAYRYFRLKYSFIASLSLVILFGTLILLFQ